MGHVAHECDSISLQDREKMIEELPYSVALRAESSMFGRECLKFGLSTKKSMHEFYYTIISLEDLDEQRRESGACDTGLVSPIKTTIMEGSNSRDSSLNLGLNPILHDRGNQPNYIGPYFWKESAEIF